MSDADKPQNRGSTFCPLCGGDSGVFDSRLTTTGTRRRRKCVACGHRWTTAEIFVLDPAHVRLLAKDPVELIEGMFVQMEQLRFGLLHMRAILFGVNPDEP